MSHRVTLFFHNQLPSFLPLVKKIYYLNQNGKIDIEVDWEKYLKDEGGGEMPLTLPF